MASSSPACAPRYSATTSPNLSPLPADFLARSQTNGDLALALTNWRSKAAEATTDAQRKTLSRAVARRIVRSGFTLVMPRWEGWTSDLSASAEAFGGYYPERLGQMRMAAITGRTPSTDPDIIRVLIDDLGPWLAAECTAVHGTKVTRP